MPRILDLIDLEEVLEVAFELAVLVVFFPVVIVEHDEVVFVGDLVGVSADLFDLLRVDPDLTGVGEDSFELLARVGILSQTFGGRP